MSSALEAYLPTSFTKTKSLSQLQSPALHTESSITRAVVMMAVSGVRNVEVCAEQKLFPVRANARSITLPTALSPI